MARAATAEMGRALFQRSVSAEAADDFFADDGRWDSDDEELLGSPSPRQGGGAGRGDEDEAGECESKSDLAAAAAAAAGSSMVGGGSTAAAEPAGAGAGAAPRKTAPAHQGEALLSFYHALGGPPAWASLEQDLNMPLGALPGVTCDEYGRVVEINLGTNPNPSLPNGGFGNPIYTLKGGDISEVQWPPHLQKLDLFDQNGITGDLSKVQWPAGLQNLDLRWTGVSGDLSEVQFPASLQTLNLSGGLGVNMNITGDLSKVQWPAALQELNLMYCEKIEGTFLPHLTP
eukprot:g1628.t1